MPRRVGHSGSRRASVLTREAPELVGRAPLSFTVPGKPQPGGSKRTFYKQGMRRPVTFEDNVKSRPWQAEVRAAAIEALRGAELLTGPLLLDVTFALQRPKGHYRADHSVKASAPRHPTTRPDTTKLLRGLEDALTGIVWRDDSQVVQQRAVRVYSDDGATYTNVRITPLDDEGGTE